MFTIYEYVADLLVIMTGATLLFVVCVIVIVLVEGASILARMSRKLTHNATQLKRSWMAASLATLSYILLFQRRWRLPATESSGTGGTRQGGTCRHQPMPGRASSPDGVRVQLSLAEQIGLSATPKLEG